MQTTSIPPIYSPVQTLKNILTTSSQSLKCPTIAFIFYKYHCGVVHYCLGYQVNKNQEIQETPCMIRKVFEDNVLVMACRRICRFLKDTTIHKRRYVTQ
jgi:hypothetical protein